MPKNSARRLILCELLRLNSKNARIILRGKDYGCGKLADNTIE